MRVITGTVRGRKLREPVGESIRPTTDMVKEAIFNIVQFDIEGRRVLDLFAGTGQLGIEALSRGAAACTFVDESLESVRLVRQNLELCGFRGEVRQEDAARFIARGGSYDLVFIDPPYASGLYDKILQKIYEFDILSDGGIIVCEHSREILIPDALWPYEKGKEYRYGKVILTIINKKGNRVRI